MAIIYNRRRRFSINVARGFGITFDNYSVPSMNELSPTFRDIFVGEPANGFTVTIIMLIPGFPAACSG